MFKRYFWIYRLIFILIFVLVLEYQLYYGHRTAFEYLNENEFHSVFQSRNNERLFRLNQRFSHINIDLLLSIQRSSIQTLTYYCDKHCGGWGDRLRGITSSYVLSILLKRRFIIDMQYPCDLSNFLLPNLINWKSMNSITTDINYLKLNSINNKYRDELYSNISSVNLTKLWSSYDHILLTTNSDYITPVLKNPFFNLIISQLHIQSNESTQDILFPFIFELLFKPTSLIIQQLDALLQRISYPIICMHIRLGQNPSMPKDLKLPYRESLVQHMIEFINQNLSQLHSSIFVTSDTIESLQYLQKQSTSNRILSINGPIIHIDRLNSKKQSNELIYHGFLKVIADFYFLGECDITLIPRSGFSQLANHRRINQYSNLYMYCRGIHHVTDSQWKRPHIVC
jgi:hypothetical protein